MDTFNKNKKKTIEYDKIEGTEKKDRYRDRLDGYRVSRQIERNRDRKEERKRQTLEKEEPENR